MVDLIRDDNQIVPAGKIANGAQLVGGPHAAPRVMRRTEDQHFFAARHHRIITVEIQRIAAILNCQRALDHRPVTGAQNAEKRMINRGKQHHAIARLGKGVNTDRRAVDQPMGGENPTGVNGPIVPVLHPPRNGIKIGAVIPVIAENPVLGHLANHVLHAFRRAKIHIGNPHGNPVFCRDTIFCFHIIPFARACAIAVDYLVELHEGASLF